ncbi:hypothetical protein D3C85_1273740 [compost metagenome]
MVGQYIVVHLRDKFSFRFLHQQTAIYTTTCMKVRFRNHQFTHPFPQLFCDFNSNTSPHAVTINMALCELHGIHYFDNNVGLMSNTVIIITGFITETISGKVYQYGSSPAECRICNNPWILIRRSTSKPMNKHNRDTLPR